MQIRISQTFLKISIVFNRIDQLATYGTQHTLLGKLKLITFPDVVYNQAPRTTWVTDFAWIDQNLE